MQLQICYFRLELFILEVLHVNKITLSVSMHHGSNQEYTREYPTVTVAVVV